MDRKPPQGLFITGNNTGVGKTHVAGLIAESLRNAGKRVGVYKPAASGMIWRDGEPIWEDVWTLWDKSGRIWDPQAICPQTFKAPLAPHLAARAEGKEIDTRLLRTGLHFWFAQQEAGNCDLILVEGAGGLMSPLSDKDYVADLAVEFGFPLVVVAANRLGVINETLQTLITATSYSNGLPIAGIVLNDVSLEPDDASRASNRSELEARCQVPLLTHTMFNADSISDPVDWVSLADLSRY
ncbi:dethiobiotin synthase [Bremerella cremea]|uniref:ATP-dependent dethiobiotin synthetase BioD n=1 Tax=Bremerella cremea TaxID=1031537 RepID=A0A368KT53_9BACT|nr:dethiobiotin synthase [Bremerella cremea]RCS52825.1 dethiobiotin synthase [Bremerella cremea]